MSAVDRSTLLLASLILVSTSIAAQVIPLWQVAAIIISTCGLGGVVIGMAIGKGFDR
jgi:hypothetical protein